MTELRDTAAGRRKIEMEPTGLLAAGGVLGALASMSCCILPLALFGLGASGAWIGNLAALAPYQPLFVAVTLGFLGAGFWMAYRRPQAACAADGACARPLSGRIVKTGLWGAAMATAAAVMFPYVAPWLLEI
ncbi:MAG: mercuric transporter MerT family protein [Dongiaceae bacterium]